MTGVGTPRKATRERDHTRLCVHCGERMHTNQFYSVHVCAHVHVLSAADVRPLHDTERGM